MQKQEKQEKIRFVCGECGYESSKWLGKCPGCGSWNTLVEEQILAPRASSGGAHALPLKDVPLSGAQRMPTGIGELDRVLGGGVVAGSVVLLGGDPGIGKSTLLMQTAAHLSESRAVLYVTGEESAAQLRLRAERLGVGGEMLLLAETDLSLIEAEVRRIHPAVCVIDSIQTMFSPDLPGASAGASQVRECTALLTRLAKTTGCTIFIVGHVTKEGAIAGPRLLEHMVDTVLYFEGDRQDAFRLLRAVKNRFGSTNEIGVFEMRADGMAEITDPSKLFLSGASAPGCAVTCCLEGTRPMLVEVQALLCPSAFHNPRRMANGVENNRLALLLAVLEKKAGLALADQDVYLNVVGGIRLEERACDLAVAMSIASAFYDRALPPRTALIGELSLTGEVRAVSRTDKRVSECARLGYANILLAKSDLPPIPDAALTFVRDLPSALRLLKA